MMLRYKKLELTSPFNWISLLLFLFLAHQAKPLRASLRDLDSLGEREGSTSRLIIERSILDQNNGDTSSSGSNNDNNFQLDLVNSRPQSSSDANKDFDYYYPDSQLSSIANNNEHQENVDIRLSIDSARSSSNGRQTFRLPDKDYLSHDLAERTCKLDRGCQRKDRLNNTYLGYCTRYKLESLFSNEVLMSIMHDSSEECYKILDEFIQLDELINQFELLFRNLLTRYNCHNGYSVKWTCEDCKKTYKDWLCATNLPFYMNGERIKPCISFCERVEQRCPYLHPITKEQYGGQPVFICRDPNIPFVPEITPDIPYNEPAKCYDLCHLSENLTELTIDTLSKYDYDKCPDKNSIAEEVRSDLLYCQLGNEQTLQDLDRNKTTNDGRYPNTVSADNKHEKGIDSKTGASLHVHNKKLNELREVLIVYKSQPKTHKFGHHSSDYGHH